MKQPSAIRIGILGGLSASLAMLSINYISDSVLLLGILAFFFYSLIEIGLKAWDKFSKQTDQTSGLVETKSCPALGN